MSCLAMTGVATATVLVIVCSHALGLSICVVPAITATMNETATEPDAIRRLKQGDIRGLGMLGRIYQVQVVRIADLITFDKALAEDSIFVTFR